MRNRFQLGILIGLIAAGPGVLHAEVHTVRVLGNAFSPNDLTVQPGDTVRWTLDEQTGGGGCQYYCPPTPGHTVTADDGSFSSGPPAESFVFEYVFEEPGEFFYHCEVHSTAGRDIDQWMNGRVFVEGGSGAPFQINAGLNDAWFDPATAGQGMFITVFPAIQQMFFAWFTYDTERPPQDLMAVVGEPGHRWLTAFGPYEGAMATLEIELTSGGLFDAAQPMPESNPDGSVTIQFDGCNAATVSYDVASAGLEGEIAIQRIATDNVAICEAAAAN
jgi:plastocyanin